MLSTMTIWHIYYMHILCDKGRAGGHRQLEMNCLIAWLSHPVSYACGQCKNSVRNASQPHVSGRTCSTMTIYYAYIRRQRTCWWSPTARNELSDSLAEPPGIICVRPVQKTASIKLTWSSFGLGNQIPEHLGISQYGCVRTLKPSKSARVLY